MVSSLLAFTPLPALGSPRVTSGGQFCAHASEHALLLLLSGPNMYSDLPWFSTSTEPSPVEPTDTRAVAARADGTRVQQARRLRAPVAARRRVMAGGTRSRPGGVGRYQRPAV